MDWAIIGLSVANILAALGLIHLQNQVNRLRRSQKALAEAVSIGIGSMIEYVDVIQKEKD
jgi:hypothetical protein